MQRIFKKKKKYKKTIIVSEKRIINIFVNTFSSYDVKKMKMKMKKKDL